MYDQTGSYTALAGIAVTLLSYLGISATIDQIAQVLGAIVVITGVIKQYIAHRNLAKATGSIR